MEQFFFWEFSFWKGTNVRNIWELMIHFFRKFNDFCYRQFLHERFFETWYLTRFFIGKGWINMKYHPLKKSGNYLNRIFSGKIWIFFDNLKEQQLWQWLDSSGWSMSQLLAIVFVINIEICLLNVSNFKKCVIYGMIHCEILLTLAFAASFKERLTFEIGELNRWHLLHLSLNGLRWFKNPPLKTENYALWHIC